MTGNCWIFDARCIWARCSWQGWPCYYFLRDMELVRIAILIMQSYRLLHGMVGIGTIGLHDSSLEYDWMGMSSRAMKQLV